MTRPSGLLCLASLLLTLTACPAKTDYGQGCKLTKPLADGTTVPIEPSEVTVNYDFDYIALGSAECDDLVCLRSAFKCNTEADCTNGSACTDGYCETPYPDSADSAVGYCTRGCQDDSDCQPDYQGGNSLVCTELLFTQEYIDLLRAACDTDPDCLYNQIFGSSASAKYCIKPRGGTQ